MLLSRVADALYWLSRYLERAVHTARVVDVAVDHGLGRPSAIDESAIEIYRRLVLPPATGPAVSLADGALFDTANRNSVAACVIAARENARQVRDEIGFDPTNNLIAQDRHIRVAVGRDYADVPPTRGVYKGVTAVRSELGVAVRVGPAPSPLSSDVVPFTPWMSRDAGVAMPRPDAQQDQQQQ